MVRGSASGKAGTLIEMTAEPHTAFIIERLDLSLPNHTPANRYLIARAHVPAGTLTPFVDEASGLAAAGEKKWADCLFAGELLRRSARVLAIRSTSFAHRREGLKMETRLGSLWCEP